jgi:hypothetical protein
MVGLPERLFLTRIISRLSRQDYWRAADFRSIFCRANENAGTKIKSKVSALYIFISIPAK